MAKAQPTQFVDTRQATLEAIQRLSNPIPQISFCDWPKFTKCFGGFRKKEFTILCGSTGSGKTQLLACMSAQLLKSNVKHFVMSVETGHTDFMTRLISVFYKSDVNTGDTFSKETVAAASAAALPQLSKNLIDLSIYEDRVTLDQLCYDLEFANKERGCQVAFVDNLNFFLEVTSAQNQLIETDRVIHGLIILCKKLDMHVVMIMHPRKTDYGTRVEHEFDIKGSSTAVQEAHNIFLWNRPRREDIEDCALNETDRELYIAKLRRRGKYVGSRIYFGFQDSYYYEKGCSRTDI